MDDSKKINKFDSIPDVTFDLNSHEMDKYKVKIKKHMENTSMFLILLLMDMEAREKYARP